MKTRLTQWSLVLVALLPLASCKGGKGKSDSSPKVMVCPLCDNEAKLKFADMVGSKRVTTCGVLCLNKFKRMSDDERKRIGQQHGR